MNQYNLGSIDTVKSELSSPSSLLNLSMPNMDEKILETPPTSDDSIEFPSPNHSASDSKHDEVVKAYLQTEQIHAKKKVQVEASEDYDGKTNTVKNKENEHPIHASAFLTKKKKKKLPTGKRKIKKQLITNSYLNDGSPGSKKGFYDINVSLKEAASSHKEVIKYCQTYQDGYNDLIGSDLGFSNCKEGLPSLHNRAFRACNNFLQKTGGTTKGFFFFSGERPITYYREGKRQLSKKRRAIIFPIEIAYNFFTQEGLHDSILQHAKSMVIIVNKKIFIYKYSFIYFLILSFS